MIAAVSHWKPKGKQIGIMVLRCYGAKMHVIRSVLLSPLSFHSPTFPSVSMGHFGWISRE